MTINHAQQATLDGYQEEQIGRTSPGSVLDSEDIGQTVNPRGLT